MEDLIIYLIKSSGILTLFWCCFKLFLEKETFFNIHRVFLISGIVIALLFPFWTLTEIVLVEPLPYSLSELTTLESSPIITPARDWWLYVAILYGSGVIFFMARLGVQLWSLNRLIRQGKTVMANGFKLIESKADTSPFSFFNVIVYNPDLHLTKELETIIAHEKVHSFQWHSLDIMLIHLFSAFQWVNPIVWFYKKTLTQNLEFIADYGATKKMESSKEYQYLLLKNTSTALQNSSIINLFFTSSIKKRIVMLNKNRSNKTKAWKFSLVVPFLAFFLVAFNTNTVTQFNPSTIYGTGVTKVEFTIDKNSTAKDLENISKTLKKDYGVELIFMDISRNAEGILTAINSTFKTIDGGSGSSSTSDKKGIQPFSFIMEINEDGSFESFGYTMAPKEQVVRKKGNKPTTVQGNSTANFGVIASSFSQDSTLTAPIYIVDGIKAAVATEATDIDPAEIHSVNVLKGAAATNKYGEKAKTGAVEITTKRYHNALFAKTTAINTQNNYIKSDKEPLFIIDGVEKDENFDMGSISPKSIESIDVIKGKEAIKNFGEKGKNGVVKVTTKKSNWSVGSGINTATPNSKWKVGYGINTNDPNDILDLSTFRQNGMEKAIVLVNGVNMGQNYKPTMKNSEVESIATSVPSAQTTKDYGKVGKQGVIEITLKKHQNK